MYRVYRANHITDFLEREVRGPWERDLSTLYHIEICPRCIISWSSWLSSWLLTNITSDNLRFCFTAATCVNYGFSKLHLFLKGSKHNYQLDQVLENFKYSFYFDGITLTNITSDNLRFCFTAATCVNYGFSKLHLSFGRLLSFGWIKTLVEQAYNSS